MKSRQWLLDTRPKGQPVPGNFRFVETELAPLEDGQVLVKNRFVSLDPAMRGWMSDAPSYVPPVELGAVMRALTAGTVLESTAEGFAEGDAVTGTLGVQSHGIANADDLRRVDTGIAPLERYLGVLGMTGMTAYFGLLDTGEPKAGDTVLVSAAAGAVGSVVAQIAKIEGCRVIGIAGGPDKCRYLTDELGLDAAIDYRGEDVGERIAALAPDGIDVYFDNVGGEMLDAALANLAMRARVVICGAISQYNNTGPVRGPSNYLALLRKRARMEGILVSDNAARFEEAARRMAGWIGEGRLQGREHVVPGLDEFPDTFMMLFEGENDGKLMIGIED